jgi:hypothetical protein
MFLFPGFEFEYKWGPTAVQCSAECLMSVEMTKFGIQDIAYLANSTKYINTFSKSSYCV